MSQENDGKLGEEVGKWGAIGFFVGGGFPFIVGGLIQEYFYISAFATCFLFGWIAMAGAKAHDEDSKNEKPNTSPTLVKTEEKPEIDLNFKFLNSSPIEDEGFLRRYFTCSVFEKELNIMAIVDYNGVGPSGENRKQAIVFMFNIDALNVNDAITLNYESTAAAIEAFKNLNEINIPVIFKGILQSRFTI